MRQVWKTCILTTLAGSGTEFGCYLTSRSRSFVSIPMLVTFYLLQIVLPSQPDMGINKISGMACSLRYWILSGVKFSSCLQNFMLEDRSVQTWITCVFICMRALYMGQWNDEQWQNKKTLHFSTMNYHLNWGNSQETWDTNLWFAKFANNLRPPSSFASSHCSMTMNAFSLAAVVIANPKLGRTARRARRPSPAPRQPSTQSQRNTNKTKNSPQQRWARRRRQGSKVRQC